MRVTQDLCSALAQGLSWKRLLVRAALTAGSFCFATGVLAQANSAAAQTEPTASRLTPKSLPVALTIKIVDLPKSTQAHVTVTGPGGLSTALTATRKLRVPPGRYTISAQPVVAGQNAYHATEPEQHVDVSAGPSSAVVDYYDIVPATTKVLDEMSAQSMTLSADQTSLSLAAGSPIARSLHRGDILASGPTAAAPNGILVKVESLDVVDGRVRAGIGLVSLTDAIPRGRISTTISIPPDAVLSTQNQRTGQRLLGFNQAKRAGLIPADTAAPSACGNTAAIYQEINVPLGESFSVGHEIDPGVSFGGGVAAEAQLTGSIAICPQIEVKADWGFLRLKSLTAVASFSEDAQIAVTAQLTGSLKANLESDKVPLLVIPVVVGGVPVNLTLNGALVAGVSFDGNAKFSGSASQSATAQAGFQYSNNQISPVSNATFTVTPGSFPRGMSVDGKIDAGIKFGVSVGMGVGWLSADIAPFVQPDVYFKLSSGTPTPVEFGMEAKAGADVDLGGHSTLSIATPEFGLFDFDLPLQVDALPPVLDSINPDFLFTSAYGTVVNLSGSNLGPDTVASLNGVPVSTGVGRGGSLRAKLPAGSLATPGVYQITVANTTSSAVSNALPLAVIQPNPAPVVSGLAPASLRVGSPAQTLFINGSGFTDSSWVTFNGELRGSTFVNAGQLAIALTAADLATTGSIPVFVTNQEPGGGVSDTVTFAVTEPLPVYRGTAMGGVNPQHTNTSSSAGPVTQPLFVPIRTSIEGVPGLIGSDGTLISGESIYCGPFCTPIAAYTASGELKWSTVVPHAWVSATAIGKDGTVYATNSYWGEIIALDAATGSVLWRQSVNGDGTHSGDLMIDQQGTIYFQATPTWAGQVSSLTAVNPDGSIKWNASTTSNAAGVGVMSDDEQLIYLTGSDNRGNVNISSYAAKDGSLVKQTWCQYMSVNAYADGAVFGLFNWYQIETFPRDLSSCTDLQPGQQFLVDNYAAVLQQQVLVTSLGGIFSGYTESGGLLWTGSQQLAGGVADANGNLFEAILNPGASSYQIVALDGKTGQALWQYTFPDPVAYDLSPNPILIGPDGSLYVTAGSTLYRAKPQ